MPPDRPAGLADGFGVGSRLWRRLATDCQYTPKMVPPLAAPKKGDRFGPGNVPRGLSRARKRAVKRVYESGIPSGRRPNREQGAHAARVAGYHTFGAPETLEMNAQERSSTELIPPQAISSVASSSGSLLSCTM